MSRVLVVSNIPAPYRVPVYEELVRRGVQLEVRHFASAEPGRLWEIHEEPYAGLVATVSFDYGGTRLYALKPQRRSAVDWAGRTLVLSGWESPAAWQFLLLARLHGVPVVAFYESTLVSHRHASGPVAWVRGAFFRHVDVVLTAGAASTAAVRAMGVPADRIVTSFNSVDVEAFAQGAHRARSAAPAPQGHRYLFVGRLIDLKNVQAALEAFSDVAGPDDRFTIVGTGPLRETLRRVSSQLGVHDRVDFVGHKNGPALHEAYGYADTLVLPSTQEVWGLVVNEALAAGLHVVVSSRAGVAESVRHMTGVYVAEPTRLGLALGMTMSRTDWSGPVPDPAILQHTPQKAADAIMEAVNLARRLRDRTPG